MYLSISIRDDSIFDKINTHYYIMKNKINNNVTNKSQGGICKCMKEYLAIKQANSVVCFCLNKISNKNNTIYQFLF